MSVEEAQAEETPYGRYVTSEGWFVHNLEEALAVRTERGGALYPLEPREAPFRDVGVNVRVLWQGDPSALYHAEDAQEGFLVLAGECVLIVEEQERRLRRWDYFHCPPDTRHVIVGAAVPAPRRSARTPPPARGTPPARPPRGTGRSDRPATEHER